MCTVLQKDEHKRRMIFDAFLRLYVCAIKKLRLAKNWRKNYWQYFFYFWKKWKWAGSAKISGENVEHKKYWWIFFFDRINNNKSFENFFFKIAFLLRLSTLKKHFFQVCIWKQICFISQLEFWHFKTNSNKIGCFSQSYA